ncbi:hypothetical protein [Bacteriovorax sp. DB6_IX]|uniref:hypothetical protein n=1 Tax=Bacteriovorax sp. DB6_IX TaxID=1353530 RepID=UPI0018E01AD4|nr:hypothetical protein [Bacteriovorax sp. DB6_IX]
MNFLKTVTLLLMTSAVFANTGWSGKLLENELFNEQVREHIVSSYKDKCVTSQKDFELPPVILITAKESSLGYIGTEAPEFTVTLRTFNTDISEYVEQNFDIQVQYNNLLDKFKIKLADNFDILCL